MDIITSRLVRQAVPLFNALATLGIVLGLGALLMLGRDVLIPLALALLLSFALTPVAGWLQRIGLGRGVGVFLSVLLAFAIIAGVGYLVVSQVSDLAAQLPAYKEVIREKLRTLIAGASDGGPFSRAGKVIGELIEDVKIISGATSPALKAEAVAAAPAGSSGVKMAMDALGGALHPLATTAAVFLIAAFMLGQREDLRNRLIRLAGADDLQRTTAALDDAGYRLGKLFLTQLLMNASFGLVIGVGLWLIGLPSPFLWGVLAGVLRFLPYVGAIIGLVPPLVIAFAFDPGWSSFLWTLGLFAVIEPIVGHVIEPMVYGRSTGLSPLAVVISATIWAFLWGAIGLVLATPLTICLVVLGRHVKALAFLDVLLGDRPALQPHEMFYQRMLAGDPAEAATQARAFLKKRSLATYYDEVALNAVRRAHQDVVRGTVEGDRLQRMIDSSRALVGSLSAGRDAPWRLRPAGTEAEAAFDTIQDHARAPRQRLDRARLPPGWRGKTPALVLYGEHPMDETPAHMLAHAVEGLGLPCKVLRYATAGDAPDSDIEGVTLVYLSFIEPLSTLHLRAASIAVRRRISNARVIVCIWQETDQALVQGMRRQLRVDHIATSMVDALDATARMVVP